MLNRAIQKASEHVSGGRCSIYCIALDKRGKVLSEAGNSYVRTHTTQARFAKKVGFPERQYLHSEVLTLLRSRGKLVSKLVLARVDRNGNVGSAKPCPICQGYIEFVEQEQGQKIEIIHT